MKRHLSAIHPEGDETLFIIPWKSVLICEICGFNCIFPDETVENTGGCRATVGPVFDLPTAGHRPALL